MDNIDLYAEALNEFQVLFDEASTAGEPDRTAMTLATTGLDGRPTARIVLLKDYHRRGFLFYTHKNSSKGKHIQDNPYAALLFHWPRVRNGVQVRIEGHVYEIPEEESNRYFATRSRGSQYGAWASKQSNTLEDWDTLRNRVAQVTQEFSGREIPRPSYWTGFRLRPRWIEFWYSGEDRLHRRFLYERDVANDWSKCMLYP